MPTILSSQILKTSRTLVSRLTFTYRNVPGSNHFSIQPLKGIVVRNTSSSMEEKNRTQYDPLQTSKQKSMWKVLDEWPPKKPSSSSTKKKKRLQKNPSQKEEQIERMRRFLVKNDAEFKKDARAPKIVREKKDNENNSTRRVKSVRTPLVVDQKVEESSSSADKTCVKDKEAVVSESCQSSSQ